MGVGDRCPCLCVWWLLLLPVVPIREDSCSGTAVRLCRPHRPKHPSGVWKRFCLRPPSLFSPPPFTPSSLPLHFLPASPSCSYHLSLYDIWFPQTPKHKHGVCFSECIYMWKLKSASQFQRPPEIFQKRLFSRKHVNEIVSWRMADAEVSSGTGLQQKRLLGSRGENVGQHDFTLSCTSKPIKCGQCSMKCQKRSYLSLKPDWL